MDIGNIIYTCDNTEMTERDKGIERERERDRDKGERREREMILERHLFILFINLCDA